MGVLGSKKWTKTGTTGEPKVWQLTDNSPQKTCGGDGAWGGEEPAAGKVEEGKELGRKEVGAKGLGHHNGRHTWERATDGHQ